MLETLLIMLINSIAYYIVVGIIISSCIMVFQIIFPYSLDFTLQDHLLTMFLWASIAYYLITKNRSQNY